MYDVIVCGARCAGSPLAMLLARRGHRVLVVDRASFPSDVISTHVIHQPGAARLRRWGLLERVQATGCPPYRRMRFDTGPVVLEDEVPPCGEQRDAYAPRRTVLDKMLVDAAAEAGAEVRERFTVQELLWDGDRVTGIRGRPHGGTTVTEFARVVVGADGVHSFVATAVRAPEYNRRPVVSCGYYTYFSGVPAAGVELYPRAGRAVIAIPTNDGLTIVVSVWRVAEFAQYRADIEGNFMRTLDLAPGLAERVRNGRREERFSGSADFPNFFRKPYGPGWALAGDAGYHKDPYTAQGITDAFRDADLLAEALDAGLGGREPLERALARYEQLRNEAVQPMYEMTVQLAALEPPDEQTQQLFAALGRNPAEARRFLGCIPGTTAIPEFFAPENVARIIGGSAAASAG